MEIEEAVKWMTSELTAQTEVVNLSIEEAVGRVLAQDIYAPYAVPHFPKSAMDGYAVCYKDVAYASKESPVKLKVIEHIYAGDSPNVTYQEHTAVNVMTGGYIPEGYDAVIRQEDTNYGEEEVYIYSSAKQYENYCKIGEDIEQGAKVLSQGTYLEPLHIGLLASLGIDKVIVKIPVKVALICTGSELVDIGEDLPVGKIHNSISYLLGAAVKKAGFDMVISKICADEEVDIRQSIIDAIEGVDVMITTGGVSVGKKDLVPEVLDKLGAKKIFYRANIQPGTPTMGSILDGKPILSLSGNPYAAFANFEIYFWNIAAALLECDKYIPKVEKAVLCSEYNKKNRLRRFVRAYAENGCVYIPTQVHASSVISTLMQCNCFIDMEAGKNIEKGQEVTIRYFVSI